MASKTIDRMQAEAEAEAQVADLQGQTRVIRVNNEDGVDEIRQAGLGMSPVKATTNDADNWVDLWHAYDGRKWSGPMYMVGSRLTLRFPNESDIPTKYRGTQVWLTKPPTDVWQEARDFLCKLAPDQTDEVKTEMRAAGFSNDCSKPSGFKTAFDADEHFRKKHPRRWEAYQRFLEEKRAVRSDDNFKGLVEALRGALAGGAA